jgi:hypothetical protein
MRRRAFIAIGCFLSMIVAEQGRAQTFPNSEPQDPRFQEPFGANCWVETRTFSSLKTGNVDFCKRHMKYVPGALDCYTFETQVCEVFQLTTRQWTQNRQPLPPKVFECPEEIEPPLCPSSPALRW